MLSSACRGGKPPGIHAIPSFSYMFTLLLEGGGESIELFNENDNDSWLIGSSKIGIWRGKGVKNHMFAHFTAFSRKVPIFTPKLVIFGLQKVSKMLPKTLENIVPILGCFFDAFWCQNDLQNRFFFGPENDIFANLIPDPAPNGAHTPKYTKIFNFLLNYTSVDPKYDYLA